MDIKPFLIIIDRRLFQQRLLCISFNHYIKNLKTFECNITGCKIGFSSVVTVRYYSMNLVLTGMNGNGTLIDFLVLDFELRSII